MRPLYHAPFITILFAHFGCSHPGYTSDNGMWAGETGFRVCPFIVVGSVDFVYSPDVRSCFGTTLIFEASVIHDVFFVTLFPTLGAVVPGVE